jgi:asparagine synthase (glutamine-hydrolysing)
LFAGYDKYVVEGRERSYERLPKPVRRCAGAIGALMPYGAYGRRFLRHLALEGSTRYLDASSLFHQDEFARLFCGGALEQVALHNPSEDSLLMPMSGNDWLSALQYRDLNRYLPLDILTKVDRMTMAHSIEARPPLLDHPLVEFAATVPARFRIHNGTTKYLLKQAMRGILPDHIIDRPKQGFAVPLARWLRHDLAVFARDVLLSPTAKQRGIFDVTYVERLLRLNERGRNLDLQLWTLLSLELWCRRFLDQSAIRARAHVPAARPAALGAGQ